MARIKIFRILAVCQIPFLLLSSDLIARGQTTASSCTHCSEWNVPQAPFRIYGNTYYVGPHGLSSILISSDSGLVLIDGALPESVSQIVANIRTLGFRIEDVKLILNSHVHFDHAGGIAELQRLSGARVLASKWSAAVMSRGGVGPGDPQLGALPAVARITHVSRLPDGETLHLGSLALTAHSTPGHTPGGTSWTWQSCESNRCLNMVYADSLSPVSAEGFKFTKYPSTLAGFEKSFEFLSTVPCDILLTPHPDASAFWQRVDEHNQGAVPDPLIDASQCRRLADQSREDLRERLAAETGK
jgi:metallo-beta-lactamase class B